MIPKVIHYCWFGKKPLPRSAIKCIESWKKFMPDYVIKEWNEDNYDVNINSYSSEAYKSGKYAFVSDYARFWILYKYGGLYFDTDVEVVKNFDELVLKGSFMGREHAAIGNNESNLVNVNPGLGLGAVAGLSLYKEILSFYDNFQFKGPDGKIVCHTVVSIVTKILLKKGLVFVNNVQCIDGVYIYPCEYFCPLSQITGEILITGNTYSIHHYDGTWLDNKGRLALYIRKHLGNTFFQSLCAVKRLINKLFGVLFLYLPFAHTFKIIENVVVQP